MTRDFRPTHPGVVLREIIDELGISQAQLARDIGVSAMRISHIVKGARPVTGELALKLGRYFRQTPQFWMNMQARFDMETAKEKHGSEIRKIHPSPKAA